jgi:probable rRNA maturation factor
MDADTSDTATATGRPTVVVVDDRGESGDDGADEPPVDVEHWRRLATDVLVHEGVGAMEVSVAFVDAATIAALKRDHLDGDGAPTDVLAFPIDDVRGEPGDDAPRLLGDVVICPAVAASQAADHAGRVDDELALLLVHGLLHLLGMDHAEQDEQRAMQARERDLLERFHGPLAGDPWRDDAEDR